MPRKLRAGRSDVLAKRGVVATSQPLATQAGIEILRKGGNAVDAAIAAAAVLDVVEPFSTGCGGDAFALIHEPGASRPISLNGSGRAGSGTWLMPLIEKGWSKMPVRGGPTVTVPGAMHLWCHMVDVYGTLGLDEVLSPAIHYAREGFPVSKIIAKQWKQLVKVLRNDYAKEVFTIDGRSPRHGEIMKNLDLADLFEGVTKNGVDYFYTGDVANAIVETVQSDGGFLTEDDLKLHETEKTVPIETTYKNVRVVEHPPNGQGFAALIALNIMEELGVSSLPALNKDRLHFIVEAKKLAYSDLHQHNADPHYYVVPLEILLEKEYAKERSKLVKKSKAMDSITSGVLPSSDTVYLATADSEGRAVSFINSLYMGFGSGLVVPGYGIKLQNRGNLFSLDEDHPNAYCPRKRPFHTIIPGALYDDAEFLGVFGIMGGPHQAEAHAQVVSNIVDHEMTPQEALDFPRFHHNQTTNKLSLEDGFPDRLRERMTERGHKLTNKSNRKYGGGQMILLKDGVWIAGSDYRKDGQASGF